ncbi:MAG: NUDIX hydrolase [Pseudomonadales bacterium]
MAELFETFDDAGRSAGLVPRDQVHARGLWHKSAHVFLFTSDGRLYLQRRAAGKDLFPGRWDFSVGEHLQPAESYLDGALRGLAEELGVSGVALEPMSGVRRWQYRLPELGIADRELQQAFRGCYDGPIFPDPQEVAEVRALAPIEVAAWLERSPDDFTPWFAAELHAFELDRPPSTRP